MGTVFAILQVLIPIGLGFGLRSIGLFRDKEGEVLREFSIHLAIPALVFFSYHDAQRVTLAMALPMMAALILLTTLLFLLGWFFSRFVTGAERKAAVHLCITFGNYGWMGFGVAQALLGTEGVVRVAFFIAPWWPVFYGFGLLSGIIHVRGLKGGVPFGRVIGIASPIFACMAAGIVLNHLDWQIPELLSKTFRPFGNVAAPLILVSVGLMLDVTRMRTALKPALMITGVTLLVAPALGWLVAGLVARDPVSYKVIVLEAAMPVASMTPIFADNFDLDLEIVATAIVVSTVLSLVTIPAVAAL